MISAMNNDVDLEKNQDSSSLDEEPRVSNDGNVVDGMREEKVGDLNLNLNEDVSVSFGHDLSEVKSEIDEIRVLPGPAREGGEARVLDERKSEIDETRGLPEPVREGDEARVLFGATDYHVNGDSGNSREVEGIGVSMGSDGVDGGGEIDVRVLEMESRDAQNEVVNSEVGFSGSNLDGLGDDGMRPRVIHEDEGSQMDSRDGDFRSDMGGDCRASMSKYVSASGTDGIVRAESTKVLGSGFEMGDMVWGKVKSHPWWPGHLFNEAFASSSVRRTRRDGHVLVAFFGDSSYGWFDPTELIPYDPHYAEKSQQTNSRNFIRAVEESVDEASRRSALGLSCYCRNPCNFRPSNVPGYLVVDVFDYEPGALYSVSQMQKARESFQPAETLSFLKQLAVTPRSGESKSLDFIKSKATALAYRRSVFEEFDETYAQAFGQQPVRSSQSPTALPDKEPSRAPLSGPLVIAEALGSRKSSTKVTKPKEQTKKDRYLFKRRDEAGDLRTTQTGQGHASSSSSSAYEDGTSDTATAAYVFQKRDQSISINDELGGTLARDQVATSAHAGTTKDAPVAGPGVMVTAGSQFLESGAVVTAEVTDGHINSLTSTDAGHLGSNDDRMKKKKAAKRPAGERGSEKSYPSEKKMKKLKRIEGQRSSEHLERHSGGSGGASLVKPAVKLTQIAAAFGEDSQVSLRKEEVEGTNSVPQQVGLLPSGTAGVNDADLLQMLADLQGLALNPFHGIERNGPAIARQFFLKFRSLVFLKSSGASTPGESEPCETRAIKFPAAAESTDKSHSESRTVSSLKPPKFSAGQGDLTKGVRKRIVSERQEEIAAKRAKKITEVKSLGAEKRAQLKNPEMQRAEGKAKVTAALSLPSKPLKAEQPGKKADRPPRVEEPTYLVMKFQPGSSLPSLVELKARFARFGPLDTSLSRVFYTTNTCRVAFLYKQDAHVAYRYAMGSKSIFSNVRFMLKPVAASESQQPSSSRAEDVHGEPAANQDPSVADLRPTPLQQPVQQLKSCLKKPSGGDESGVPINGGGNGRTTRVRFNMGEVKGSADSRGGALVPMESRNTMLSSSSSSSSSSSIAMDVSNNQRFNISSHPLQPPLPHAPQFLRAPIEPQPQYHHSIELPPRNNLHDNLTPATEPHVVVPTLPSPRPNRDISQQMMNLLTRCHDVVTNVKSILGYVPYHPL